MRRVAAQLPPISRDNRYTHLPASLSEDVAARRRACRPGGRPVVEPHAEREPVLLEHFLDLGQRLLAEVRRAQQLDFRALHEVADVVDVLGLQAVAPSAP